MSPTAATRDGSAEVLMQDSAFLVYGVVEADRQVPEGLAGVGEQPVELIRHGRVAAAVGPVALDRPVARKDDLVAYGHVVDALAADGPVAPVQFGSVLPDAEAVVHDVLEPQHDVFAELLEELAGRRQYTLRATYVRDVMLAEVVAADPEIRRLREQTRDVPEELSYGSRVRLGELVAAAVEDRRGVDAEALLEAVLPLTVDHRLRPAGGMDDVLDVALLVDDERVDELVERLEGLAEAVHERIRLRLVGPVAAYDFVGDA